MSLLLREAIGGSIRRARTERRRTLRDVSHEARVSLGYLSEIERGRKEPSSELLAAICDALSLTLPDLLDDVADTLRPTEVRPAGRPVAVVDPALRSAVEEALEPAQMLEPAHQDDPGQAGGDLATDAPAETPAPAADEPPTPTASAAPVEGPAEQDEAAGPSRVRLVGVVTVPLSPATVVCTAA